MKRTKTMVHERLNVLGVTVTQFIEDFGMSSAGFYRALDYRKNSDGQASDIVLRNAALITQVMDRCDTRKMYNEFVKQYGVKEKLRVAESIQSTFANEVEPTSEVCYTEAQIQLLQDSHHRETDRLVKKIDGLAEENKALKTLLKIYMP